MVSTAAFHARVRGSVPGHDGLKETKMFFPHPRVKLSIVGSLRDREVACSASNRQGSNFESCVWRTVSSHSSHHPQEVLLAQFSLYVHKGGLNPDSFHFLSASFEYLCYGYTTIINILLFKSRDELYRLESDVYIRQIRTSKVEKIRPSLVQLRLIWGDSLCVFLPCPPALSPFDPVQCPHD